MATDGAPSMTGKKAGVVAKLKRKVHTANGELGFWTFHVIIHEEALWCKSLKMDHVKEVIKTVKIICARGLNHRQFDNLPSNEGASHGLPYRTEVKGLCRVIIVKRVFELRGVIVCFRQIQEQTEVQSQSQEWIQGLALAVDKTDHLKT